MDYREYLKIPVTRWHYVDRLGQQLAVNHRRLREVGPRVPPPSPAPEPAPALGSLTVNGRTLVLTYGAALDESSVPAAAAFGVSVDRARATAPESVEVSGRKVTLSLARSVLAGQDVRVSYQRPSTNPLRDVSGNVAASFGSRAVENESAEGVPALPLAGAVVLAVLLMVGGLRRGGIARSGRL